MRAKSLGIVIASVGIVGSVALILLALTSYGSGGMNGWGHDMMDWGNLGPSTTAVLAIIIGFMIFIISVASIVYILTKDKERRVQPVSTPPKGDSVPNDVFVSKPEETSAGDDEHLVSRLLDGDERVLYQLIASSNGEILQKDLVAKKVFSKAKVTRLLDKLEERGLIVRERYGSTNKVKLVK